MFYGPAATRKPLTPREIHAKITVAQDTAESYPQRAPVKATVMGVRIGQTPVALGRLDSITVRRNARSGEDQLISQARQKREENPVRAGFGKDTLSSVGAAAQAVSSNLESARQITPSVEELRQEAEAAAEVQRRITEQQESPRPASNTPAEPSALEKSVSARPKAEPLARFFSPSDTNDAPEAVPAVATPAISATPASAEPVASPNQDDGASALLNLLA